MTTCSYCCSLNFTDTEMLTSATRTAAVETTEQQQRRQEREKGEEEE